MNNCGLFTYFEYENKSNRLRLIDTVNYGLYRLQGRSVTLYSNSKFEEHVEPCSKIEMIAWCLVNFIALPLLIITIPAKYLSRENYQIWQCYSHLKSSIDKQPPESKQLMWKYATQAYFKLFNYLVEEMIKNSVKYAAAVTITSLGGNSNDLWLALSAEKTNSYLDRLS